MVYRVQIRNAAGKWSDHNYIGRSMDIDALVAACCRCDEDGLFPSDLRICNGDNVVVSRKSWTASRQVSA